jgi:hypothetical protein
MIEISFNNGASHCEASNFDRNELPNAVSPVKGCAWERKGVNVL